MLLSQSLRQVGRRQIRPITQLSGNRVENRIKNDVAEVAGAHLVDLWIGERPAHTSRRPITGLHTQFMAHVAGWPVDTCIHQDVEIDRLQTRGGNSHGQQIDLTIV